ncbi:MAG: hypothetical protein AAB647_03555 [Patescibacteria group bacterium]
MRGSFVWTMVVFGCLLLAGCGGGGGGGATGGSSNIPKSDPYQPPGDIPGDEYVTQVTFDVSRVATQGEISQYLVPGTRVRWLTPFKGKQVVNRPATYIGVDSDTGLLRFRASSVNPPALGYSGVPVCITLPDGNLAKVAGLRQINPWRVGYDFLALPISQMILALNNGVASVPNNECWHWQAADAVVVRGLSKIRWSQLPVADQARWQRDESISTQSEVGRQPNLEAPDLPFMSGQMYGRVFVRGDFVSVFDYATVSHLTADGRYFLGQAHASALAPTGPIPVVLMDPRVLLVGDESGQYLVKPASPTTTSLGLELRDVDAGDLIDRQGTGSLIPLTVNVSVDGGNAVAAHHWYAPLTARRSYFEHMVVLASIDQLRGGTGAGTGTYTVTMQVTDQVNPVIIQGMTAAATDLNLAIATAVKDALWQMEGIQGYLALSVTVDVSVPVATKTN